MSKLLGNALKAARVEKRLTQDQVAQHLGVSRAAVTQWESGANEPSTANLLKVCNLLDLNVAAATAGMVQIVDVPAIRGDEIHRVVEDRRPEVRDEEEFFGNLASGRRAASPNPIPIKAVGLIPGSKSGDFVMSTNIIDFVARPPGLSKYKDVYAIHVPSTSLSPRFEIGEFLFLSPSRTARSGDDILIEFAALGGAAEGSRCALRRLDAQDNETLTVRSFSPAAKETIPRSEAAAIHTIIPLADLLGIG